MSPFRLSALALLAATSCAIPGWRDADDDHGTRARGHADIDSARELDQEGVRAFSEARYTDAIRYFRAAYRLGGPPSELWNIARSHERLDDPEAASTAIEEYLAIRGLSPQDRAEAERELRTLRTRPSLVTVTSKPAGAIVSVDGKQSAGATPLSVEVAAGAHTLAIRRDGFVPQTRPFEARFGRAVIVSLDLERAPK